MRLRLPKLVISSHYSLTFTIDPYSDKFKCDEEIDLTVVESGEILQLNAENLTIHSAKWNDKAVEYSIDKSNHVLTIQRKLTVGETAKLAFLCSGSMSKDMYGIYRSSYEDDDEGKDEDEDNDSESLVKEETDLVKVVEGVLSVSLSENSIIQEPDERLLVSTQFEPLGARRAFPCIDDPALKSQFTISLIHPSKLTALSNCEISKTERVDEKWTKTMFKKSPVMLTYLVAFVVGDLECLRSETLPISVWTLRGESNYATYALDAAEKCLPFYEELFDYKYPLSKLELVAIPEFAKSAMENFGLITFKASDLLINLERASQYRKEVVFETVAHEISHQWFGNLVTMDFWDDLWLNEGFATWMLWYAMAHFNPTWKVWENYVVYTLLSAFSVDGRASTHPVIMPIESIKDIEQAGDEITYKKGCATVVMLFDFLGEDTFFTGLQKYISKHAWGNSKSTDLWKCLESVSGKQIERLMDCWTTKSGFPVIRVTESDNNLILEQDKYCSSELDSSSDIYAVPITIKTSEGLIKFILDDTKTEIEVPEGPYFINPGHTGYYLTLYPPYRWFELSKCDLTSVDRIGALLDIDLLANTESFLAVTFLQLAEEFIHSKDPTLLNAIVESFFDLMDVFLYDDELWTGLCKLGQRMIKDYVSICHIKHEDDSPDEAEFNKIILRFAAFVKDPSIDSYCEEQYNRFSEDTELVDADECPIVLRNVVRRGNIETWNGLWDIFQAEKDAFVKEDILASLGNLTDLVTMEQYLGQIIESNLIKPQDYSLCLRTMCNTILGVDTVWDWMTRNWSLLGSKLEFGSTVHLEVIGVCLSHLCTEEHLQNLTEFFDDKDVAVFGTLLASNKEKIRAKIMKAEQCLAEIKEWLASPGNILLT